MKAGRRRALQQAAALAVAPWSAARAARIGAPGRGPGQGPRVIVVGGGFGGATCALYLRRLAPGLQVRLFEPRRRFITGPLCNTMLVGLRDEASVSPTPAGLAAHGVDWQAQAVAQIDPVRLRVRAADGDWHSADRLVLAPGIELRWDRIEGLHAGNSERMPHGWVGDASLRALRQRLRALEEGATVLIGAPPNPYRCPPGPYERASLFAWALRGRRAKILIADAKDDFSKRALFLQAWGEHDPGRIDWWPRAQGGEVLAVDTERGEVRLAGGERLQPDLACIIPPQQATALCREADLADATGWCPVQAANFESQRHAGVHVIGDAAAAHPLPKSAFAANSAAKLCALAIVAALQGRPPPVPRLLNTCYSFVAPQAAISVSGVYSGEGGRLSALAEGMSPLGGDADLRAREARDAQDWYATLLRDSFG